MPCVRCNEAEAVGPIGWCATCDREYDSWVRRYASDLIGPLLAAMTIVSLAGMVMPLLGFNWLFATTGVFGGFGTLYGLTKVNQRRRRRQFLRGALPRAYLASRT